MKQLFAYIIFLLIIVGCGASNKKFTYNNSYYTYKIYKVNPKSENRGKTIVFMKFNYLNKNIFKNPSWIKIDCDKIKTESDFFEIKYDNVLDSYFRSNVSSFGCFTVDTKPIKLNINDSIVFNFHFAEVDTPIIDCQ